MVRVLLTAFEPYGPWKQNSSWLTLMELTRDLPKLPQVTTRLYPVEFDGMRQRLTQDLAADYHYAIHLGQMPGAGRMVFESVGLNVAGPVNRDPESYEPLVPDGPIAFRTSLPISDWIRHLRAAGIPSAVSYHAGLYLCNATAYLSPYLADLHGYVTRSVFIHLPLATPQVVAQHSDLASLPLPVMAGGLRAVLDRLMTETVTPARGERRLAGPS